MILLLAWGVGMGASPSSVVSDTRVSQLPVTGVGQ